MSNEEFLRRLESALTGRVPQEELDDAMNYHREYFAEAGENAANEIPAPEEVAEQIIRDWEGYLRKRQFHWAKPAVIAALCVGVLGCLFVGKILLGRWFGLWTGHHEPITYVTEGTATNVTEDVISAVTMTDVGEQLEWDNDRVEWITDADDLPSFDEVMILGDAQGILNIEVGFGYSLYLSYNDRETWDYDISDDTLVLKGTRDPEGLAEAYDPPCVTITIPWNSDRELDLEVDTSLWEIVVDDNIEIDLPD